MTVTWPTFPNDTPAIGTDKVMGFRGGTDCYFLASSWLLPANNLSDVGTKATAFNNISPLTTTGDIIYFDGTNNVRLAIGSAGKIMEVVGGLPAWVTNPALLITNNLSDVNNKTTAFDNISPLTTTGDVIYFDGTNNVRLGIGSANQLMAVSSGIPAWINNPNLLIANNLSDVANATTAFDNISPAITIGDMIYFNGTHNVPLAIGSTNQLMAVIAGAPTWINNPAVLPAQVQNQAPTYTVDSGTANTIVLALTPTLGAYADGQYICFKAAADNTGATTVNTDGLGAVPLVKNPNAALTGGEIAANGQYLITYNSTISSYVLH